MREAERDGLNGLNITHPCKQLVIPHLDELSDEARALGAVNTVVLKSGRRYGHTPTGGVSPKAFGAVCPDADLEAAVQIGAGGAGVATAYAILSLGLKSLIVFDLDPERAIHLAQALSALFPEAAIAASGDLAAVMDTASGLIHATPTGMAKYPGMPLAPALLSPRHWVAEIVYFPLETELLKTARLRGAGC